MGPGRTHPWREIIALPHRLRGRFAGTRTPMTEPSRIPVFRMRDLPADERPRERMLRLGPSALTNEELGSLLLRTGTPSESALERARTLLAAHGGLCGLAGASTEELSREAGVGPVRASTIAAAI